MVSDAAPFQVDHVAVIVRSADAALGYFRDRLGLTLLSDERVDAVGARLVALDGGAIRLQVVEPIAPGPLQSDLDERGEGLHHLCFVVPRLEEALERLGFGGSARIVAAAGRRTVFLPPGPHGVRTELLEYVDTTP